MKQFELAAGGGFELRPERQNLSAGIFHEEVTVRCSHFRNFAGCQKTMLRFRHFVDAQANIVGDHLGQCQQLIAQVLRAGQQRYCHHGDIHAHAVNALQAGGLLRQARAEITHRADGQIARGMIANVLSDAHLAIARAEDVLEHGFNEFWKPENNPIVNGPFILTSFDADLQTAELTPNPEWWKEGPILEKVSFQFVPDQQIVGAMALNDQIDASLAAAPSVLRSAMPDYFRQFDAIGFNTFWMQPTVEPTSDPKVREALIKSVDWSAIFQAAFPIEGSGVMTAQTLDDIVTCQNPDATGYPFDVEGAQAALAESSYGSAENMPKLRVTRRGSNEFNNRALQAVIEFWRQNLGIENVEFQQDPNSFGDDFDKINLSRDDVVIRFPDAATYMWAAGHSGGPVAGSSMLGGYKNEALEAAVDEALTLAPDDPRRCELALEAQAQYEGDYVIMHFGKPLRTANARAHVKEYYSGPDVSVIEPWKIYIERM